MKRWNMAATFLLALGLSVGMAAGAYAEERTTTNGNKAEGIWVSDKQEGPGRIYYENGRVFEGYYSKGSRQGPAITYETDGSRCIWTYFDNKVNGLVLKISKDGTAAASFWEDDKEKSSVAVQSWRDGDTRLYAKEKSDINGGKAIAVFPGGNIYAGEWKNGEPNGWGTLFFPNGIWQAGEWKDSKADGVVYTLFSRDSDVLSKAECYANGEAQGASVQYEHGGVLVSVVQDGKSIGPGVYIYNNGTIDFFEFKDGKISDTDPTVYKDKDGNQFLRVKDGKDGTGLKVTKNGNIITFSSFKNGAADGFSWIYRISSQTLFAGNCKAGKETDGRLSWLGGSYYLGTFDIDDGLHYDKGIFKSFDIRQEGTFNKDAKLVTGTATLFTEDGSVSKKFKDGKETSDWVAD